MVTKENAPEISEYLESLRGIRSKISKLEAELALMRQKRPAAPHPGVAEIEMAQTLLETGVYYEYCTWADKDSPRRFERREVKDGKRPAMRIVRQDWGEFVYLPCGGYTDRHELIEYRVWRCKPVLALIWMMNPEDLPSSIPAHELKTRKIMWCASRAFDGDCNGLRIRLIPCCGSIANVIGIDPDEMARLLQKPLRY